MLEAAPHHYQAPVEADRTLLLGCLDRNLVGEVLDCTWMIEGNGVWLEAYTHGLPGAEAVTAGSATSTAIRSAFDALVRSPGAPRPDAVRARSCDEMFPADARPTPYGPIQVEQLDRRLDAARGVSGAPFTTIALWMLAEERLGWTACDVTAGGENRPGQLDFALVLDARGAGWAFSDEVLEPVGELEAVRVSCGEGEGGGFCSLLSVRGNQVVDYEARDSRTDVATAIVDAVAE